MRINQYIAKHAGLSRRKADELIKQGKVRVNGQQAELHHQVVAEDTIEYQAGERWQSVGSNSDSGQVLLLYKPPKVVTTRSDPEGRKTVYDILPRKFFSFKTAGRLDYMSEGLLILSENGHLIFSLTHPKFKTKKTYLVALDAPLTAKHLQQYQSGSFEIDGYALNPVQVQAARLNTYIYVRPEKQYYWYEFILTEGRNRQIRKMAELSGRKVRRLIRVSHGPFLLTQQVFQAGYVLTSMV